jgi:carboxylesterase type B
LQLAVWAPIGDKQKLPVIVYFTGGGFTVGGINIEAQLPHQWVERTQSHIVVTTKLVFGLDI